MLAGDAQPTVLHVVDIAADGSSLIDTWITLAGGVNFERDIAGAGGNNNAVTINQEQLLAWNPDAALQVQWAGQTLHADLFTDFDVRAETRSFYQTFLNYALTDADLQSILMTAP